MFEVRLMNNPDLIILNVVLLFQKKSTAIIWKCSRESRSLLSLGITFPSTNMFIGVHIATSPARHGEDIARARAREHCTQRSNYE